MSYSAQGTSVISKVLKTAAGDLLGKSINKRIKTLKRALDSSTFKMNKEQAINNFLQQLAWKTTLLANK